MCRQAHVVTRAAHLPAYRKASGLLYPGTRPNLSAVKNFSALSFLLLFVSCTTSHDISGSGGKGGSSNEKIDAPVLAAGPSVSGSTPSVAYRSVSDTAEAERLYQSGLEAWSRGDRRMARTQWIEYLKQHSAGQFADQAHLRLAQESRERYDHRAALVSYNAIIRMDPPSPLRGEAQFGKAQSERALGQGAQALDSLAQIQFREIQESRRAEVFAFWADTAAEQGRWLESSLAALKTYWEAKDGGNRARGEGLVREQIDNRLNESDLQFILREYPNRFPANEVRLRLASLYIARGQRDQAQEMIRLVLVSAPAGTALHTKAQQLQSRFSSLGEVVGTRVGVLMPLSGRQEALGRAVVNGLQLALAKSGAKVDLVLADVGPDAASARKGFDRLVLEEKVAAVVGPLVGKEADMVASLAVEYGVPNISLSSRSGLIEKGPFVFRSALTTEKQVRSLVRYAREQLNAKTFAVLFPEDAFGEAYAKEYFDAVREAGGEITAAESYEADATDFKIPVENMIGKGFSNFRRTEYNELLEAEKLKLSRDLTPRERNAFRLAPIVDFDVLFIPDTYKALGQIVPALLYADVTQPMLLGPATWRNPRLLDRAGQYLDRAFFVDFYASERDDPVTREFLEQYQVKYGQEPSALSALGYDIGLALHKAYASGSAPQTRDELRSRLEDLGEVRGALGKHDWGTERDSLAELQLFRARKGSFQHQGGIPAR